MTPDTPHKFLPPSSRGRKNRWLRVRIPRISHVIVLPTHQKLLVGTVAFLLAIVLQMLDWPAIFEAARGYPMVDRQVYARQIIDRDLRADYFYYATPLDFFINEWAWSTILRYSNDALGLEPERIFALISIFVLWQFAAYVARNAGPAYIIFLINPLLIDFAFSQLRIAFALSIVMFVLSKPRSNFVVACTYIACTTIHTATVLFALMHLAARFLDGRKMGNLALLCLIGVAISLAIGPLRQEFLGAVGDRRAEYVDAASSFMYLSFWVFLFSLFLIRWRDVTGHIDGRYAIIILSLVATNLATGGYSIRFLAASLPSLIVAMSKWPSSPISLALLVYVPYTGVQWLYWLQV